MKATAFAIALFCLALSANAETRVDFAAAVGKDFIGSPTFNQAARGLWYDPTLGGFAFETVIDHIGVGGSYLVAFQKDDSSDWWLDWNAQAIYASYHLFGPASFVDPFVEAGAGCAGRVSLGPSPGPGAEELALTLYPFVGAGASVSFNSLRLGAKVCYAMSTTAIPATDIPVYEIGRFQVSAFAGISIGGRWGH